ncbi:DUF2188 domain-containing protein [Stenotrophomonas maltophilia]|nr:DUF2188 domain-containing protein [Stenotrophomonas maltophilia]
MARKYWYVVTGANGWTVREESSAVQTYRTQAEAIAFATTAARGYHERTGKPSGVRIQTSGGTWREERSYGNDPFPPRG